MIDRQFALIGPGRLGLRLAVRLNERGWTWVAARGRAVDRDRLGQQIPAGTLCDTWTAPARWPPPAVVFVAVPDDAIGEVATQLTRAFDLSATIVLHTSGLHDAESLAPCRSRGARVGSWHPLQSFPPLASGPVRWNGVWCAVEGDREAVLAGTGIATELGLNPWPIAARDKARYHAAASVAANLTHVLLAEAARIMAECGLPTSDQEHPLWPLVEASLRAALCTPDLDLLTGPLARGDAATVARHLEVLPEHLREVYRALAKVIAGVRPPALED